MKNDLERLINLSRRTGDRLIIHDPTKDADVVLMPIAEYEDILDKMENKNNFRYPDVRELSSSEMLDRINRDIAVWRADKEMEERCAREDKLQEELFTQGPFDPFQEVDYHPADWHSAGNVLGNKYQNADWLEDFDEEEDDELESNVDGDLSFEEFMDREERKPWQGEEEIKVEDIPDFDDLETSEKKEIPFKAEEEGVWQEEPLEEDSEPMFYEEPV